MVLLVFGSWVGFSFFVDDDVHEYAVTCVRDFGSEIKEKDRERECVCV